MENEGVVNIGGMCSGFATYSGFTYINIGFWMFKMYKKYIL
ncbi:dynamin-related protein 1E [Iris pallida]|uniref:Dynamin-related protein 1E n=1 Tax=Iris pallida TaxID=29817 RepID=A0AAX6DZ83_IRIPA|nr:dynamin-related protein 1E [Iris pallida]